LSNFAIRMNATRSIAPGLLVLLLGCSGTTEPVARVPTPPLTPSSVATVPEATTAPAPAPSEPAPPPRRTQLDRALGLVRTLRDEELKAIVQRERELKVPAEEGERERLMDPDAPYGVEIALLDIVRRGGKGWESFLESLVPRRASPDQVRFEETCSLEVLTALRRVQGRPDPLEVRLEPSGKVEIEWPDVPEFHVWLRNRDTGGPGFSIWPENGYRGGFLRTFRFEVERADGTRVPGRQRWGEFGGAIFDTTLFPGNEWSADLPMRDYIASLDRGDYTVWVQFADEGGFSNARDLRGRVYWSSNPLSRRVGPRRILLTKEEDGILRAAFRALPEKGPIRFVAGTPVDEHTEFIRRDSPEATLLRAGWRSAPALLDALVAPDLSPRRRAWALALLFGVSGVIDPRPGGVVELMDAGEDLESESAEICEGGLGGSGGSTTVLGESEFSEAAWECLIGGSHSTLGGQGGPFVMTQAGGGGEPSRMGQDWLIRRWRSARRFLEIEIR